MTARRRTNGRRGPDGKILPLAPVQRAQRLQAAARGRYAVAQTDRERLAVVVDYARSSAAAAERAGIDTAAVMDEVIRTLREAGDSFTDALAQEGRKR